MSKKIRLISHEISVKDVDNTCRDLTEKIKKAGDKPHVTVSRQLALLEQLSQFDLGRFLLQHQGVNGYWTHYFLTHPWFGRKTGKNNRGESFTELEKFLLERSPIILATQERFEIFLKENQLCVKNDAKLATIPSGMMNELLYLDYEGIHEIELVGIDYDEEALKDANTLAKKLKLDHFVKLFQKDAWDLNIQNSFDLISSNGLTLRTGR